MCAMQRNYHQQNPPVRRNYNNQYINQPPVQEQQNRQQTHYRFRWPVYIGVPLVVFLFFWFVSGIDFAFEFPEIMQSLGIVFTDRFVLLGCLGILSVITLLIIKVCRK